jgi:hypothetical protein
MVVSILVPNRTPFQISRQALDCFHGINFAYQGRHPPSQFATKQLEPIQYSMTLNQPWFVDSGANNHIARDIRKPIKTITIYNGSDHEVAVGNGSGLTIASRGSNIVSSTNCSKFVIYSVLFSQKIIVQTKLFFFFY